MASYGKRKISNMHDWFFDGYKAVQVVENGKKSIKYEYRGFLYGFRLDEAGLRKLRIKYVLLTLLCLAAWLLGITRTSSLAQTLPGGMFAVSGVPLIYFIVGLIYFLTLKPDFNHRQRHRSYDRMQWGSRFLMGVSALALLISVIYTLTRRGFGLNAGNAVFLGCSIVLFGASCALLRLVGDIENGYTVTREKERGLDE